MPPRSGGAATTAPIKGFVDVHGPGVKWPAGGSFPKFHATGSDCYCHKAYHPSCVGKGDDFNSSEEFICEWHTCCMCKARSRYFCFCCAHQSFCKACVAEAEFVPVLRKTKGFCRNCLRMAIMIERNVNEDSDGELVDFDDKDTYEGLFKDYWGIVKDKEGLTRNDLEVAYASLKTGLNYKRTEFDEVSDEQHSSDNDSFGSGNDGLFSPSGLNGASNKRKSILKGIKSKKNGHMGWGSTRLIEFLLSIGKDVSNSLDQFGAAEVVKEYIRQNNLLQKDKKKIVVCDLKLKSLFRKSKLKYNRISSLLESHITANMTSEDESLASSEDNTYSAMTKKARTVNYESGISKHASETNKECFASLVPDNINLIYLKKSLVMDLLKEPDTFESKVTGCFVRVENDPRDYCFHKHKKLHQLGQVIGIKKSSEEYKIKDRSVNGTISTDIVLCISNIPDVKISMLSNEDFEEDECEDLRLLAQKGSFKRLTVGDLEEKEISIRKDIVSHRINKALRRLDMLIEYSKCHRLKIEHMDERERISEPSYKDGLLKKVPHVVPETDDSNDIELQVMAQDKSIQKNTVTFQGTSGERTVSLKRGSEDKSKGTDWERAFSLRSCSEEKSKGTDGKNALSLKTSFEDESKATKANVNGGTAGTHFQKHATEVHTFAATQANAAGDIPCLRKQHAEVFMNAATKADVTGDAPAKDAQELSPVTAACKTETAGDTPENFFQKHGANAIDANMSVEIINIDDDDGSPQNESSGGPAVVDLEAYDAGDTPPVQHETNKRLLGWDERVWYYNDPQGHRQGAFTLAQLCQWRDDGYFPDDFKVWREGQSSDSAILLDDALYIPR